MEGYLRAEECRAAILESGYSAAGVFYVYATPVKGELLTVAAFRAVFLYRLLNTARQADARAEDQSGWGFLPAECRFWQTRTAYAQLAQWAGKADGRLPNHFQRGIDA